MYQKRTVLVLLVVLLLGAMSFSVHANEPKEASDALNALLIGVQYPPEESAPANWSKDTVCDVIFNKLLWDDFLYSEDSYLSKAGLQPLPSENRYLHFSLDDIQRLTHDAFGIEFPTNVYSKEMFISDNELVIARATGETTELLVQDCEENGETVTAIGIALRNFGMYREFLGYFEAIFKLSPDTIYGYTLTSVKAVDGNQNFAHLTASASSEMKAIDTTHYAAKAIDGDLNTCWAESVRGVGTEQWLELTADGEKLHVFAIAFSVGERNEGELLPEKGRPTKIALEFENGERREAELQTTDDVVVLQKPVDTDRIKITVLDALKGSLYDATCISEIRLLGFDGNAYFPEREEETEPTQEPTVTEELATTEETQSTSAQETVETSTTRPAQETDRLVEFDDEINIWIWVAIAVVLVGVMICAAVLILLLKKKV